MYDDFKMTDLFELSGIISGPSRNEKPVREIIQIYKRRPNS